jgi:hypothetical protein
MAAALDAATPVAAGRCEVYHARHIVCGLAPRNPGTYQQLTQAQRMPMLALLHSLHPQALHQPTYDSHTLLRRCNAAYDTLP